MTDPTNPVADHYAGPQLAERILAAATAQGVTEITPLTLAPADEFHTGGLPATRELATVAGLQVGWKVLDIGSGLGGPARILASEFGCDVTGIDITPEFVRSAAVLTGRCGLGASVRFELGDALNMPFADSSFDCAWTQHVVMNIDDRATLYREAHRVLRPGGVFVFFDILKGNGKPLDFPLPWANDPSISFLYTPTETRTMVETAGFRQRIWEDVTEHYLGVITRQAAAQATSSLSLQLVMGSEMPAKMMRARDAVADGRLVYARAVFERA